MVFLFGMLSCAEKPDAMYIDEDRIVQVLADLHLIEASIATVNAVHRDSIQELALQKCAVIHDMDPQMIEDQILYISLKPAYHRQIYQRVLDTLEHMVQNAEQITLFQDTTKKKVPATKNSSQDNERKR